MGVNIYAFEENGMCKEKKVENRTLRKDSGERERVCRGRKVVKEARGPP